MSTSVTRTDRVLSVRERDAFKREIADRKKMIQGHLVIPKGDSQEGMSPRRQGRWESFMTHHENKGQLQREISSIKKILDKGSPRDLSRKERRTLEKQVEEDREFLKKNMVPERIYQQRSIIHEGEYTRTNPKFANAQRAVFEREVSSIEFQRRANRFKNNMRELDPENPESSNIERFRPKK